MLVNYILAFCDKSYIVEIMLIIKTIFKIACYITPLLVIIVSMIHIFKSVMTGKDEDLKDSLKVTVKRIIAGLLIAFLPALTNYVFTSLVDASEVEFLACFESASKEKVASLKEKEEKEEEAKKKAQEKEDEAKLKEAYDAEMKKKEGKRQSFAEWKKQKEEEERKKREEEQRLREQQQQQQQGGYGDSGSVSASVSPGTSNIIIGDSRTVGMCATLTGDWSKCQFSNGGKNNATDFFIAQSAMGYSWFESTAIPAVNGIISNNQGTKYNIYSLMGVNYLLSDIDKYIRKYNELASGPWKDHKIILVSVTPVNEVIEARNGYSTKNANIEIFNAKLKNGVRASNVAYCDVYSQMGSNFGTGDGLHYTGESYRQIYNLMKQC